MADEAETTQQPAPSQSAFDELKRRGAVTPRVQALYDELQKRRAANAPSAPDAVIQPRPAATIADRLRAAVRPPGEPVAAARERLSEQQAREIVTGRFDPNIDYETGGGFGAKQVIERSDNPDEARPGLENIYGKGKVGQDAAGRWYAEIDGKKVDLMGGGKGFGRVANRAIASTVATLPETAGGIVGGLVGLPAGPLGAVAGAGIGAIAGKGLDELTKLWRGFYKKTPEQEAMALAMAGLGGGVGQAAGPVVSAAGRGAKAALNKMFFESTPEVNTMTKRLLDAGARPPTVSYAPGWKSWQKKQQLRNLIKGDPQLEKNIDFANQRLREILDRSGIPADKIDDAYMMIIDPRRAISTTEEGREIVRATQEHVTGLAREAESTLATAKSILDRQATALEPTRMVPANANPHVDFAEAVRMRRREFGTAIGRVYDDIHAMADGQPIVPTTTLRAQVKGIVDALPKTGKSGIFQEIANLGDAITIKDAQRFRTRLREEADSGNLTPGATHHDYNTMKKAFDSALDPDGKQFEGVPPPALQLLKQADALYKQGIRKFEDTKLNQIVNDIRNGKVLEPDKFAASLFDTESTARIANFRDLVGPTQWRDVQASYASNLWRQATKLSSAGTSSREISGRDLVNVLDGQGARLDAVFGKAQANEMREYANRLAAINGDVSPQALQTGRFRAALETSIDKQQQLDTFVKSDILRAFAKGGPKEVDTAVDILLRPGQGEELRHVVRFFGSESEPVQALRNAAIKRAFDGAIVTTKTGLQQRISGGSIDDFMSQYTREEQELLFPHGLAADLRVVADEMKALFPKQADQMQSLSANAVANNVGLPFTPSAIKADHAWLVRAFEGWLADRPSVIRFVADIDKVPGPGRTLAQNALQFMFKSFMNQSAAASTSTTEEAPPARTGTR